MEFKDYLSLSTSVISNKYRNQNTINELKATFKNQGYVTLPNFYNEDFFSILQGESTRMEAKRIERNFTMPGYNTPRHLSVIGGKLIFKNSLIFPMLYLNFEIRSMLSSIIGSELYSVNHEEEFMVINYLERKGGTHGWHVDDPRYALVIILQAPERSEGGYLEVIPDWKEYCASRGYDPITDTNMAVKEAYANNQVKKIFHNTGDCYLLNAGNCLHRVAPISGETRRIILNMAFDDRVALEYGYTADVLYGEKDAVTQ